MKPLMNKAFPPVDYLQFNIQQLQHIRQWDQTVDEYAEESHKLIACNDLNKLEQLLTHFTDGFRPGVTNLTGLGQIFSLAKACQQASLAQKQSKK